MTLHVRCGSLFSGREEAARQDCSLVVGDDGRLAYVGAAADAPKPGPRDEVRDYGGLFVMPGLIDVHTYLSYGNAKT